VIAEVELPKSDIDFIKPDWIGEEVTNNPQYYNAILAERL
jgi:adenylate cyclase